MRYYAQYNDSGKLIAIGTGPGGTEITEAEYNTLLSELREKAALVDKLYSGEITIADVPTEQNSEFLPVFSKAHTLITLVQSENDIKWQPSDAYLNLIWNVKKHQSAAGIKCLNWVVIENKAAAENDSLSTLLQQQSRRFGFRTADALQNRESYRHIKDGYGAADLINSKALNMSMADVYARRELLVLADFIWQNK